MIYAITAGFIVLDMVTGIVKAFKEKNYCSSVMREGLFHKCGSILCIVFATLVDYAQCFVDIGVTVPVTNGVCVYVVLMEAGSIIENVCAINPDIMPGKIKAYFRKLTNENT